LCSIFLTQQIENALSRHEQVQLRRENQNRSKREKVLQDVEKTDQRAREAKRRNRWSWGGNITGTNIFFNIIIFFFSIPQKNQLFFQYFFFKLIFFPSMFLGVWWYNLSGDSIPEQGISDCKYMCKI